MNGIPTIIQACLPARRSSSFTKTGVFVSVTRPVKELKGFRRVVLEARETRTAEFELPVAALDWYGKDMRLTVEPGAFKATIRRSSRDIALEGDAEILP